MNDKIKALVLNISDYKENDLLLQVISEDKGFLTLSARGGKKVAGKNHYSNLCLYEFIIDYKDNKTMFSIHNAKLLASYYEDNDLSLLTFKNVLVEITSKAKGDYEFDLFKNICFTLSSINKTNMYLLGSLYISYILKLLGISPNVDGCIECHNSKVVSISSVKGGFVCLEHLGQDEALDVEYLKKFRLINKADFDKYEMIKDLDYVFKDFDLMINFYEVNSDNRLKSYRLFKDVY